MNVVDLILVAILACVTLHFYFRKKKKALSSGKEKEKPIREAVRKEGQERACPVICVVFQPELEEEELAAEIADMYLHGRAYYYSGKPLPEQPKEEPISLQREGEDTAYHFGSFLIYQPMLPLFIPQVAVNHSAGQVLAAHAF